MVHHDNYHLVQPRYRTRILRRRRPVRSSCGIVVQRGRDAGPTMSGQSFWNHNLFAGQIVRLCECMGRVGVFCVDLQVTWQDSCEKIASIRE